MHGSTDGGLANVEEVTNDELEGSGGVIAESDQKLVHWRQTAIPHEIVFQLILNLHKQLLRVQYLLAV